MQFHCALHKFPYQRVTTSLENVLLGTDFALARPEDTTLFSSGHIMNKAKQYRSLPVSIHHSR